MFESSVYQNRRRALHEQMAERTSEGSRGLAVFLGNNEAPMAYRGNDINSVRTAVSYISGE